MARSRTFIVPRSHSNQKRVCCCPTRYCARASGLRLYHCSPIRYRRSHTGPVSHQHSSCPASMLAACATRAKKPSIPAVGRICWISQISPHSGAYRHGASDNLLQYDEETFSSCPFALPGITRRETPESSRSKYLLAMFYRSNVLILLHY